MSRNNTFFLIFIFTVLISSVSCSDFRKIQKSTDWQVKYNAAMNYYEKKDYYRTTILLEEVLPIIKGTKEAEKAQFIYAYAHYYQKQYLLSSHYFKSFIDVYSRSEYTEESMYMYAYSLYKESPNHNLDQSNTYEAIQAMQTFINRYSKSKYVAQATDIINELQEKLARKDYENAKLYYKLKDYKAALVAFENFHKGFPDSDFNEEISYLEIETEYAYAKESIITKQKERYQLTVELYENFIDRYPQSKFLATAQDIYDDSLNQLKKLQSGSPESSVNNEPSSSNK